MADLEALLRREYEIKKRRSWWRATICFRHLERHFVHGFPISESYGASSDYLLARRREGAADATIRNELVALSGSLALAARCGAIASRPELMLPIVGNENARKGFFRRPELARLVALLPDPLKPLVRFTYVTGFRSGEVRGLCWDRVDWIRGAVRLESRDTKSREPRVWPFARHPELRRILTDQLEASHGIYVFHRNGKPVRDFKWSWKKACCSAGLSGKLFHDLRRSAARNMVLAGVPTQIVLKLLGWKSEAMLRRYGIFDELDLADGVGHYARYREHQDGDQEETQASDDLI